MKKFKFMTSVIIVLLLFAITINVSAVQQETGSTQTGEVPYQSYTYWVDYNTSEKTPVYSKPMYEVRKIVSAQLLGADENSRLNDVTTDMDGNIFVYEVAYRESLGGNEGAAMGAGEWDMTLFTCTVGGEYRVTVRCELVEEIPNI